jgi:hypothetical protein
VEWTAIGNTAAVVSAICAVIAALIALAVYRQSRGNDLTGKIDEGDRATRAHAQQGIDGLSTQVGEIGASLTEVRESVARIEQEQTHHLTARNLGPIHDKVNQVAQDVASNRAETRAVSEQLRTIQNYLMKNLP